MAQHDFNIDNQSAPAFRGDLNNALEALVTLSSGATAPATTYANMLWYDTDNNILKMRSEADDAWIDLGTLDQGANTFNVANLTNLTQTQVEDDTSTVYGQVSGERLSQAVAAFGTNPTSFVYNYQEFTASGTWSKPSDAEAGDLVLVWVIAAGGGGGSDSTLSEASGGRGGAGILRRLSMGSLASSLPVIVGSGGGPGSDGGDSRFGSSGSYGWIDCSGGRKGRPNGNQPSENEITLYVPEVSANRSFSGGEGRPYGGGNGSGIGSSTARFSDWGGSGGANYEDGEFPGGGGGQADFDIGTAGSGANGFVAVWCIRE